jgi:ubiquinone biosynthesis protein
MNFLKLIYQVLKALYFSLIYGVFNIINERGDRKFFSYLNPFYFKFKKINHGKRIAMLLEAMGPIFIKFGQLLSTRTDIVTSDIIIELQNLTNNCAPFDTDKALSIIQKELKNKGSIDEFKEIKSKPMAAASLAQVHEAILNNGDEVVIKVLRPNINKKVKNNIAALKSIASILSLVIKESDRLKFNEIVLNYEDTILKELDLGLEAANTELTRSNFKNSEKLYIPKVYWELSSEKILVLEKIDGIPCTDIETMEKINIDKKILAENGVLIFLDQVFRDNFFHADMHPGNIFVSKKNPNNPSYIAIDCAISGSLSNTERFMIARMLQSVIRKNYKDLAKLFINSGWVQPKTNEIELENTLKTCCEPILEKPLSEIEFGKLLLKLFDSTRKYGLSIQPSLILLQKTLIHIEGMGRQIYPELDFWGIAEPYLDRWLLEQINPLKIKDFLIENKDSIAKSSIEIPDFVTSIFDEIQSYSELREINNSKLNNIEKSIKNQKYLTLIFVIIALILIISFE